MLLCLRASREKLYLMGLFLQGRFENADESEREGNRMLKHVALCGYTRKRLRSRHISGNCFSKDHQGFLLVCEFADSEYLWFCHLPLLGTIHHPVSKFFLHPYFQSLVVCKSCIAQHLFFFPGGFKVTVTQQVASCSTPFVKRAPGPPAASALHTCAACVWHQQLAQTGVPVKTHQRGSNLRLSLNHLPKSCSKWGVFELALQCYCKKPTCFK